MFKRSVETEFFPNKWKVAKKVTPIFKKGTKSDLFINLSKKAFDTIDHENILRKLANYRGDERSLRWLTSHLSN